MTGSGTINDPYVIYNVADLQAIDSDLSAYYVLDRDINCIGYPFVSLALLTSFTGQFDGQGHTIANLAPTPDYPFMWNVDGVIKNLNVTGYSVLSGKYGGFFDTIDNEAVITNVHISGTIILDTANGEAGIFAYGLGDCTITNCSTHGTLSIPSSGVCGGFVGDIWGPATLTDCYSTVDIIGTDTGGLTGASLGGFIGYSSGINIFTRCYSTGNVTQNNTADTNDSCGGFIGYTSDAEEFEDCYATGNVVCHNAGGGFIGFSCFDETFTGCYSTGSVTVSGDFPFVGGFTGFSSSDEHYYQCYSTGDVTVDVNAVSVGAGGPSAGGFSGMATWDEIYEQCFCTGDVVYERTGGIAHDDAAGGFVGESWKYSCQFLNCYTRSNVTLIMDGVCNIAGFSGCTVMRLAETQSFTNCYSTGLVTLTGTGGSQSGFINYHSLMLLAPTVTSCYWDIQTSEQSDSDAGSGELTADMKIKETFVDWDFTTPIWYIHKKINDGYPAFTTFSFEYTGNVLINQLIYRHAEKMRFLR